MEPGDDAGALEASLIENIARLDPDEMTQYETFARLIKDGKSIDDIAAVFGLTDRTVKQRLALGNLLPKIRDLYRGEKIDIETIRHLTLASKSQQKEWLTLFDDPENRAPSGFQVKQWLLCRSRHNSHYAEYVVMPSTVLPQCQIASVASGCSA
jgi:ParB family chromosome partitioning protein